MRVLQHLTNLEKKKITTVTLMLVLQWKKVKLKMTTYMLCTLYFVLREGEKSLPFWKNDAELSVLLGNISGACTLYNNNKY